MNTIFNCEKINQVHKILLLITSVVIRNKYKTLLF